jgi:hypothetical protein
MASKVLHYASYEAPHEGDNCEYWSNAACGPEYENVTHHIDEVTCKKCLKTLAKEKEAKIIYMKNQ